MPRQADPDLETRILHAAQKLWKKGAEKSLTMRAVAKAAGTNTPAVYRRFRNRDDILRGLLQQIQQDVIAALQSCASVEAVCEGYLQYALSHAHEYELFYTHAHQLSHGRKSPLRDHRPSMALVEERLAERFGGVQRDHTRLSLALWTVAHGTAMLLISKAVPEQHVQELRAAFSQAVAILLRHGAAPPASNPPK